MKKFGWILLAAVLVSFPGMAQDTKTEPGFTALFDGKSLNGWNIENKGEFSVKDGVIFLNKGRGWLRSDKEYKDFELRMDFRFISKGADSGIFIRKPQLQCRDYLVAGPYKELKKYKPQDWNEIEVTVTNGVAYCTCNGEVLQFALKVPNTGPIGLEADRGQMEYRRIRLSEQP